MEDKDIIKEENNELNDTKREKMSYEEENQPIEEKIEKETRTMEELLVQLRTEKNWTIFHLIEKLQEVGITVDEKKIKKWEIGLEYPDLDTIYKLSEIYMIPSETFIVAKSNSYEKGMESIHMIFIKWFCYITGFSLKIGYISFYVIIFGALIGSFMYFIGQAKMVTMLHWE